MNSQAYGFKVEFSVPMRPVGKGRPRFTRFGHAYTPTTTSSAEALFRTYAIAAMRDIVPTDKPVAVALDFIFVPPKSMSKKRRSETIIRNLPMTKKPDIDNAMKLALDAMNGHVFVDDKQVSEIKAAKFYGSRDEIRVCVWEVERYEQD